MFHQLFDMLSGIHKHTQALESFDWDEDRLNYCVSMLEEKFQEISTEIVTNPVSLDTIKSNLKDKLCDLLSENEINILLDIFEDSFSHVISDLKKEDMYEN